MVCSLGILKVNVQNIRKVRPPTGEISPLWIDETALGERRILTFSTTILQPKFVTFDQAFDVAAGYREISADGAIFMKLLANAVVVDVQINRTLLDSIVTEISPKINIAPQCGLPGAKNWIGKLIPVVVIWKLVLVPTTNVSDK
jgi:hypothetical protein